MLKNNPQDKLLATLKDQGKMFSYPQEIEKELLENVLSKLTQYVNKEKIFICNDQL
jgi:biopolymer transport protein ExbD